MEWKCMNLMKMVGEMLQSSGTTFTVAEIKDRMYALIRQRHKLQRLWKIIRLIREVVLAVYVFLQRVCPIRATHWPIRFSPFRLVRVILSEPFPHRTDTQQASTKVRAKTFMVARSEYAASVLHILSEYPELSGSQKVPVFGVVRISIIGTVITKKPDLVVVVQRVSYGGVIEFEFAVDRGIEIAVPVGGVEKDPGVGAGLEGVDKVRDREAAIISVLRSKAEPAVGDEQDTMLSRFGHDDCAAAFTSKTKTTPTRVFIDL